MSALPPIDSPETFAGWHMPWPAFEVDWQRAALVLVDMQNYGCNPEAGLGPMLAARHPEIAHYYLTRVTQTVVPNARRLLEAFRAAGRVVVYTRHGPLLADGSDMAARRRRRDADALATTGSPALWHRGTFEHEVVEELGPAAGELVIDKNTSSALNSTGIEGLLRNMGDRDGRPHRHGDRHVRRDDGARRRRPRAQRDRRRGRDGDVLRASPPRRAERLRARVRSGLGHRAGARGARRGLGMSSTAGLGVILLPGIVTPAEPAYALLLAALPGVDAVAKDLEVYATPEPPEDYSLELEVDGVLREADVRGWERFHLVGFSGGGAVSLACAAAHPDRLASLALIEPAWAGSWDLSPAEQAARLDLERPR